MLNFTVCIEKNRLEKMGGIIISKNAFRKTYVASRTHLSFLVFIVTVLTIPTD